MFNLLTSSAMSYLAESKLILRKNGKLLGDLEITSKDLATIIKMVDCGDVNRMSGRKILTAVMEEGVDPVAYCKENRFNNNYIVVVSSVCKVRERK